MRHSQARHMDTFSNGSLSESLYRRCCALALVFQVLTHRKVTLEVTPMTFITAQMKPTMIGRFLINCQIHAHSKGRKGPFSLIG